MLKEKQESDAPTRRVSYPCDGEGAAHASNKFSQRQKRGVHHLYATAMRGEMSDAAIEGYLCAASQIEDLWQQIDEKVATVMAQGTPPWAAYAQVGSPLAFIHLSRAYQVFVKELLAAVLKRGLNEQLTARARNNVYLSDASRNTTKAAR